VTANELELVLAQAGIPRIAYGIREISAWEGFCIIESEGVWSFVYSSRGKITHSVRCASESQACELLLEKLQEEFPVLRRISSK